MLGKWCVSVPVEIPHRAAISRAVARLRPDSAITCFAASRMSAWRTSGRCRRRLGLVVTLSPAGALMSLVSDDRAILSMTMRSLARPAAVEVSAVATLACRTLAFAPLPLEAAVLDDVAALGVA